MKNSIKIKKLVLLLFISLFFGNFVVYSATDICRLVNSSSDFEISNLSIKKNKLRFVIATFISDSTKSNHFKNQLGMWLPSYLSAQDDGSIPVNSTADYHFDDDVKLTIPTGITEASGEFLVAEHPTEGNAMVGYNFEPGTNTAVADLDLIPAAEDYQITWKETYQNTRKHGFLLRANGVSITTPVRKKGYLFQVDTRTSKVNIYNADDNGYILLTTASLNAPGEDTPRWFRAKASGTTLELDYSDDGENFTNILSTTDVSHPSGKTQYTIGYSYGIRNMYVDEIDYDEEVEITNPVTPSTSTADYHFDDDVKLTTPTGITETSGEFLVAEHPTEGNTMIGYEFALGTTTAVADLDLIPEAGDYQITWKETYQTPRKHGFILRGQGLNSQNPGTKQGYLFQVDNNTSKVNIFSSNATNFTLLTTAELIAPGVGTPRWFRAKASGNTLELDYSDDGETFTNILSTINTNYTEGTTQYTIGYGFGRRNMYVDEIDYDEEVEITNPVTPSTSTANYHFDDDVKLTTPMGITETSGEFLVAEHPTEGNAMIGYEFAPDTKTAVADLELIPETGDYQITWKETYQTPRKHGFILRGQGLNSQNPGTKQGYLFQVDNNTSKVNIFSSNATNFTLLTTAELIAPGVGTPRWFRAKASGNTLELDYSDDGETFTNILSTINTNYTEGTTQYTIGYGFGRRNMYVDEIDYDEEVEITNPVTPSTSTADYHFDDDVKLTTPTGITETSGEFLVAEHPTEGNAMIGYEFAPDTKTAVADLDLIPEAVDYQITWKETYRWERKHGFVLRAQGNNTQNPGTKQGYLFQVDTKTSRVNIYRSNATGFFLLKSSPLTAPGRDIPRWFRAKVYGTTLELNYSDDGETFINILSTIDGTYTEGTTQYTIGYGFGRRSMYVDEITMSTDIDETPEGPPTNGSPTNINPYISNVSPYQVIQRNNLGTANIYVEGTYIGTPTGIQAQWNNGTWANLTLDSDGSGTFSGTITGQSQGQGTLTVRFTNNTSEVSTIPHVGIGDVYVIAGQSNASGRGNTLNSYTHSSLKAATFGNHYKWGELVDPVDDPTGEIDVVSSDINRAAGSPWPLVATEIMDLEGVPVAFIPTAKNGSSLLQWQPSVNRTDISTLYGAMYNRVNSTQGGIKAVLYYQGENDALKGTLQATYESMLNTLADAIEDDFGVPVVVGQIGYSQREYADVVRAAQVNVINSNTNVLLGPATYDINLSKSDGDTGDGLHFKSDSDMQEFARRWSFAITKAFYGQSNGYGPIVDALNIAYDASSHSITVPFIDTTSPSVNINTSTVNASAFILTDDVLEINPDNQSGVNEVSINSVSVGNNTVTLFLNSGNSLDASKNYHLTYASLNSATSNAIYDIDNLPAQPFYSLPVIETDSGPVLSTSIDKVDFSTLYAGKTYPINVAHRGKWQDKNSPENSKSSMLKAENDSKVDWMEIDVKPSNIILNSAGDAVTSLTPIIFHDDRPHRLVSSSSWADDDIVYDSDMSGYVLSDRFGNTTNHKLLTLEDFFVFVKNNITKPINLDISNKSNISSRIPANSDLYRSVYKIVFLKAVDLIYQHGLNEQVFLKNTYTVDDDIWGIGDTNMDISGENASVQSIFNYYHNLDSSVTTGILYAPKFGDETISISNYVTNWINVAKDPEDYPHPATVMGAEVRLKADSGGNSNTIKGIISSMKSNDIKVGIFSEGTVACEGTWENNATRKYVDVEADRRASFEWLTEDDHNYDYIINDFPDQLAAYKDRDGFSISRTSTITNSVTYNNAFDGVSNGGFSTYDFLVKGIQIGSLEITLAEIQNTAGTVLWRLGITESGELYTDRMLLDGNIWRVKFWDPRETGVLKDGPDTPDVWIGVTVDMYETRIYIGKSDGKFDCLYLAYGLDGSYLEDEFGSGSAVDYETYSMVTDIDRGLVARHSELQCRTDMYLNAVQTYFDTLLATKLDPKDAFSFLNDENPYFSSPNSNLETSNDNAYNGEIATCTPRNDIPGNAATSAKSSKSSKVDFAQEEAHVDFLVYPNPSSGSITVEGLESGEIILMYDVLGNIILKSNKKKIDVSYLSAGLYFIKAIGHNNSIKFVKK